MQWAVITVEVLCIDAMSSFSGGGAMQWAAKAAMAVEVLCKAKTRWRLRGRWGRDYAAGGGESKAQTVTGVHHLV